MLDQILTCIGLCVVFSLASRALCCLMGSLCAPFVSLGERWQHWYWRCHPPKDRDWYRMSPRKVAWWTNKMQADAKAAAALRGTPSPRYTIQDDRGWMP